MERMNAVPFDTLKLARDLEAAGLAPPVAAGSASALADALISADLATKSDVAAMGARLEARIGSVETGLEAKIGSVQAGLEAKIGSVQAGLEAKIGLVQASLEAKIGSVQASLEAKIELLRRDMTIKLGGMIFVAVGVLLAAMRLMPHP
jgi:hypothetical protein